MNTIPSIATLDQSNPALTCGMTVAAFISQRIDELAEDRVKQSDIAELVGFPKPNMITMIKQGKTKLPLEKVGLMARALRVDPKSLMQLAMREYSPATWTVISDIYGADQALTSREKRLITQLRTHSAELELMPLDDFDVRADAVEAIFGTHH